MRQSIVILIVLFFGHFAQTQAECKKLLDLAPRGFACFHCLNKGAPRGVAPFVSILKRSCLKRVALSFVLDDSFGYDEKRIISAIKTIHKSGRELSLHLYVFNGPAQRRWNSGLFGGFATMNPIIFREALKFDPAMKLIFIDATKRALPILELSKRLGVKVSMAPGLEDNLDNEAFQIAIDLIERAIPEQLLPKLIRSACSDCATGNEVGIIAGVEREKHTADANYTTQNGIVCNDGEHFSFATENERSWKGFRKLNSLVPAMRLAGKLNNVFLLWSPKFQDTPADFAPRSPIKRRYRAPNLKEQKELISFLATR